MALKKIPARFQLYVFVFLVATPLSFILSAINTFIHLGIKDHFFSNWMYNWLTSFIMVYPLAVLIVPRARKLITKLVEHE